VDRVLNDFVKELVTGELAFIAPNVDYILATDKLRELNYQVLTKLLHPTHLRALALLVVHSSIAEKNIMLEG
jgi:hypothetical protein